MGKKCILCTSAADYSVKDSSEYYCTNCALENFSDVGVLQEIENDSSRLSRMVEETIPDMEE